MPSGKCGNINAVVAIGAVVRTENRVESLSLIEPGLYIGRGNGHSVTWLMAARTRTPIGSYALEKRPCQVDTPASSAVGLRRTIGIPEECSIGDEGELLSLHTNNDKENRCRYKNADENAALALADKPGSF